MTATPPPSAKAHRSPTARLAVLGGGAVALIMGAVLGMMLPPAKPLPEPQVMLPTDPRVPPSRMLRGEEVALVAPVRQHGTGAHAPVPGRTLVAISEPAHPPASEPAPEPAPSATPLAAAPAEAEGPAPQIIARAGRPAAVPPPRPGADLLARSPVPPRRPAGLILTTPDIMTARLADAPAPVMAALDLPAFAPPQVDACANLRLTAIPRAPAAQGGRAHLAAIDRSGRNRDAAVAEALLAGHLPDFLRRLVPVTMAGQDQSGRRTEITLCVMPDYLALGQDSDFVRMPMGLPAARRIAEGFGMILPTARMVDAIHAQARLRLSPQPMTPGPQMASTGYILRHNETVEDQRARAGAPLGVLISGHKKDVVLSNRLTRVSGRVAIYGWHQANGRPIQPLSTVHGEAYADYSHGIRLIARTAFVNGQAVDVMDLLTDTRVAGVLSDEGALTDALRFAALR